MLQEVSEGHGYILDIQRFHEAMRLSLEDYGDELSRPEGSILRNNLWTKMDAICAVRIARGLLYEADPLGLDADPPPTV
jgi:hypothetical protein